MIQFILLLIVFLGQGVHAGYLTVLESGEMLPQNQYRIGVIPQVVTSDTSGINIDGTLDALWNESASSRFYLGVGKMDFHLGGSLKYVPFPDVDKQPAIGLRTAAWYARYKDEGYFTVSVGPLVSKKVKHEKGIFAPYVALPINYTLNRTRDYYSQQFVVGTEFVTPETELFTWAAEIGLNLKDSYSYIAMYVGYQFDQSKGIKGR